MLNGISVKDGVLPNGRNTIQEKESGNKETEIIRQEIADGKKSERGGISNMGEKLGKGKFSWREKGMAPARIPHASARQWLQEETSWQRSLFVQCFSILVILLLGKRKLQKS